MARELCKVMEDVDQTPPSDLMVSAPAHTQRKPPHPPPISLFLSLSLSVCVCVCVCVSGLGSCWGRVQIVPTRAEEVESCPVVYAAHCYEIARLMVWPVLRDIVSTVRHSVPRSTVSALSPPAGQDREEGNDTSLCVCVCVV